MSLNFASHMHASSIWKLRCPAVDDRSKKGINYRMTPENFPAISAAGIDCCVLANNHVLDWGAAGLADTLETLSSNGMCSAGAGHNRQSAEAPAVLPQSGGRRLLVFGLGAPDSGIPPDWAATDKRTGVARLEDLTMQSLRPVAKRILESKKTGGDLVVASIHWGGNWGGSISRASRSGSPMP